MRYWFTLHMQIEDWRRNIKLRGRNAVFRRCCLCFRWKSLEALSTCVFKIIFRTMWHRIKHGSACKRKLLIIQLSIFRPSRYSNELCCYLRYSRENEEETARVFASLDCPSSLMVTVFILTFTKSRTECLKCQSNAFDRRSKGWYDHRDQV